MKKNITLSAEETAIREARRRAAQEHTALNELFRRWLDDSCWRRGKRTESGGGGTMYGEIGASQNVSEHLQTCRWAGSDHGEGRRFS